jgi:hypothetical protein
MRVQKYQLLYIFRSFSHSHVLVQELCVNKNDESYFVWQRERALRQLELTEFLVHCQKELLINRVRLYCTHFNVCSAQGGLKYEDERKIRFKNTYVRECEIT